MCEDRLTPASLSFIWFGVNPGNYKDPTNWGGAVRAEPEHTYPITGDEVSFGSISSESVTVPQAYAYKTFQLTVDYTGTVTVQDDTSAVTLEIRSGAIKQATAADSVNDFTVTGTMTFTGGTFNSNTTLGILHLATPALTPSVIGGAANTTATTGSIIAVNGNALLTYTNGTIAFANGSYFDSLGGSTVDPTNLDGESVFTHVSGTNNPHSIQGNFKLKSSSQKAFSVKTGGHLQVVKSLEIAGNVNPTVNTSASLGMTGGTITGTNSIQLKVNSGFSMSGGTLATSHAGVTNNDYTFVLTGAMTVSGGTVELYQDANGLNLGALSVYGSVNFTGGEYKAKIVGTPTSDECNRWISSGTFTTAAAATVTPVVSSGTLAAKVANAPRFWEVITAVSQVPMTAVLPGVSDANFTGTLSTDRNHYYLRW